MYKKNSWWRGRRWLVASLIACVAVLFSVLRWATLPTPRYFWPRVAEDWSAWATSLGAVGTILAVVYAARTLKSTSKAQLAAQRDRRAEMDFIEAKEAEDAIKLRPGTHAFPRAHDEYGPSYDAAGARIFVNNYSLHPFHEVQAFIPDGTLNEGVTLSEVEFWEADLEHNDETGWKPGKWSLVDSPAPSLPGTHLFTLGTVPPGKCRGVSFTLSGNEFTLDWETNRDPAEDNFGRDRMLAVTFVDRNGRTWQRTSRDRGAITRIRIPTI